MPQALADPPQYDLVFFVEDYASGTAGNVPVSVKLVVTNGTLVAQYAPLTNANP